MRSILFFILFCHGLYAQHIVVECNSSQSQIKNDSVWINNGEKSNFYDIDRFIIHYDEFYGNIHRSSVVMNYSNKPILEVEIYRGHIQYNYFNEKAYYPSDTLRLLRIQGARLSYQKYLNHKLFYFDIVTYNSGDYEIYNYSIERPETAVTRTVYSQ